MNKEDLRAHIKYLSGTIPPPVLLVAAAKTRTADEVRIAIEGGILAIGYNYVQEAEAMQKALSMGKEQKSYRVKWHLIGHLQRNKAKKAVQLFDMIETIDSPRIAKTVNSHCEALGKILPVLIEINSGKESNKTGALPTDVPSLVRETAKLKHLKVQGLMTMGPRFGDPEKARPYFRLTKSLFDQLKSENIPNTDMKYISMGMSNTYQQAIEEGANIVRIGTKLFGERSFD
ncbi:MAG: YggS family pyridoxal phosphate-dependent enzyme [Candidatus Aminicenantes bacterium]|nr:YggS family pyridoxal phosphate-dependent enzyme [Candidatus Aminicenantes bacterium]